MQIKLRYFAVIREALGKSEESREVPPGTKAGDLTDAVLAETPRLARVRRSLMLMVNQEYVDAEHLLSEGDELALIPPVSGGENTRRHFRITADVLDPREVEEIVAGPDRGAVVTFTGAVRNHARGREVLALEYEAYEPAAVKMLERLADEILEKWGLERVGIVHRTGRLEPGEASVVIAISSAHRDEAFDACRYAIVRLKEIVPIWKKEFYADGSTWIGSELDYQVEIGRVAGETAS